MAYTGKFGLHRKWTKEDINYLIEQKDLGKTLRELADEFGVHPSRISHILKDRGYTPNKGLKKRNNITIHVNPFLTKL